MARLVFELPGVLMQQIGLGWCWDRRGNFCRFQRSGVGESGSRYVAGVEQSAGIAGHSDVSQDGVPDISNKDSFPAGAADVRKGQPLERLVGINPDSIY